MRVYAIVGVRLLFIVRGELSLDVTLRHSDLGGSLRCSKTVRPFNVPIAQMDRAVVS